MNVTGNSSATPLFVNFPVMVSVVTPTGANVTFDSCFVVLVTCVMHFKKLSFNFAAFSKTSS
jgi:hypothetical protein